MKTRPILFSGPMVQALLAGSKTQTRRIVKLPHQNPLGEWKPGRVGGPNGGRLKNGATIPEQGSIWHTRTGECQVCPYGQPGDRLWVRETFRECEGTSKRIDYRATTNVPRPNANWRPSIFMPRWASRITLEIVSVRVERLQDISEADAMAEGVLEWASGSCAKGNPHGLTGQDYYELLWSQINGRQSWDANPWVWVVEFRRVPA